MSEKQKNSKVTKNWLVSYWVFHVLYGGFMVFIIVYGSLSGGGLGPTLWAGTMFVGGILSIVTYASAYGDRKNAWLVFVIITVATLTFFGLKVLLQELNEVLLNLKEALLPITMLAVNTYFCVTSSFLIRENIVLKNHT